MIIKKKVLGIITCLMAVFVTLGMFFNLPVFSEASAFPEINSDTYVLMDAETGQVLVEKGMNQRMYPASILILSTVIFSSPRYTP